MGTYHVSVETPAWKDRDVVVDCESHEEAARAAMLRAFGSDDGSNPDCRIHTTEVINGSHRTWYVRRGSWQPNERKRA